LQNKNRNKTPGSLGVLLEIKATKQYRVIPAPLVIALFNDLALSNTAKALWLDLFLLSSSGSQHDFEVKITQSILASHLGMHRSSLYRPLQELENLGYLLIRKDPHNKSQWFTIWVRFPEPAMIQVLQTSNRPNPDPIPKNTVSTDTGPCCSSQDLREVLATKPFFSLPLELAKSLFKDKALQFVDKLLWVALFKASYFHPEHLLEHLSLPGIAKLSGLTASTCHRSLYRLQEQGYIQQELTRQHTRIEVRFPEQAIEQILQTPNRKLRDTEAPQDPCFSSCTVLYPQNQLYSASFSLQNTAPEVFTSQEPQSEPASLEACITATPAIPSSPESLPKGIDRPISIHPNDNSPYEDSPAPVDNSFHPANNHPISTQVIPFEQNVIPLGNTCVNNNNNINNKTLPLEPPQLVLGPDRMHNLLIVERFFLSISEGGHPLNPSESAIIEQFRRLRAQYPIDIARALEIKYRYETAIQTARAQGISPRQACVLAQQAAGEDFACYQTLLQFDAAMGGCLDLPEDRAVTPPQEIPPTIPGTPVSPALPVEITELQALRVKNRLQKLHARQELTGMAAEFSLPELVEQVLYHATHWAPHRMEYHSDFERIEKALCVAFKKVQQGEWRPPYGWVSQGVIAREQEARAWKRGQLSARGWQGNIQHATAPKLFAEVVGTG
jgi:DNA-binding MarR family transcriptional regulator